MKHQETIKNVIQFHGSKAIITNNGIEAEFGGRLEAMIDTMRELSYRFPFRIDWNLVIDFKSKGDL